MSLLSLHVEDIVVPHLLPCLSLTDTWRLRAVCRHLYHAVYLYYNTHMSAIAVKCDDDLCPGICTILRNAYRLRYLDIEGNDSEKDTRLLLSIVQSPSPPALSQLSLSSFHLSGDSHVIMTQLSECCRHLNVLEVKNVRKLSDHLLETLLQHCRSLSTLTIINCNISHSLLKVLPRQQNLKLLKVSTTALQYNMLLFLIQ